MTTSSASAEAPHVVIGVGASAGGVEALTALVRNLPATFEAAVVVVLHVAPSGTSVLPQILDRSGPLPARAAEDGMPLRRGVVYVAPPDRHVLVENGALRLSAGPRENGHRPAADPLFRSIAEHDALAVGVILSGTRDDGTQGLARIKAAGGIALVQDPDEALYTGMPASAQRQVAIDHALPVARLAAKLVELSIDPHAMPVEHHPPSPEEDADATRYTCPDCGGVLWRDDEGDVQRYRCSVGHAYSAASLDGEHGRAVENALWAAARMLGDRRTLLEEMATRAEEHGHDRSAVAFRERAVEAAHAADTIRQLIENGRLPTDGTDTAP